MLDALRCPGAHADGWLVAMVHEADGPRLLEAELACPTCGATFAVHDGVAWWCEPPCVDAADTAGHASVEAPRADRLAALLGVAEGPHPVLLVGARTAEGAALAGLVSPPQWWLNPPPTAPAAPRDAERHADALPPLLHRPHPLAPHPLVHAVLHVGPRWPLASGVVAAVAVDDAHATPVRLAEAVRVLRAGGRLVAPATAPLPDGVRELARDETEWVAEATGPAGGLVSLRRRHP